MFDRKKPLVSIVIPSWFATTQHGKYGDHETYWFAQECLKRLLGVTSRKKFELIIIDNGSTLKIQNNNHRGWLGTDEYWGSADILIRNSENLGFAPSCNQGFDLTRGEYICCLNNDILVWRGWLDAVLNVFKQNLTPPPGVVMTALVKDLRDAREALKVKQPDFTINAGKYGSGAEFGSLWVAPKKILDEVRQFNDGKVFNEIFKLGMGEDRLLWQQIRKLGYETYRCHDTRVFHQGNMSISKVEDRKKYTNKNREILEIKKKELWEQK